MDSIRKTRPSLKYLTSALFTWLLSIWIRQVGWILWSILCSPKWGEHGRKTDCGEYRTNKTNRKNKPAEISLSTQILASAHGLESFMEVVLHLNCFSHNKFQSFTTFPVFNLFFFFLGNLKVWGFEHFHLKKKKNWLSTFFSFFSF